MKNLRVGFSRSASFVGRLIRWFTHSDVNHTFFLVDEELPGGKTKVLVITADWDGMVVCPVERFRKQVTIADVPPLKQSIDGALEFVLNRLETPYSYKGLLGMMWVEAGRWWFKRRWSNPIASRGAFFCSQVVVKALQAVDYPGSEALDAGSMDPGEVKTFLLEM